MKRIISSVITAIILLSSYSNLFATANDPDKPKKSILTVSFPDSILYVTVVPYNFKDFSGASINAAENMSKRFDEFKTETFKIDKGHFKYEVNLTNPVTFAVRGALVPDSDIIAETIFLEPGDSIDVNLINASLLKTYYSLPVASKLWKQAIMYTGNGVSKFECQQMLNKMLPLYKKGYMDSYNKIDAVAGAIQYVTNSYKSRLSPIAYAVLRADNYVKHCSEGVLELIIKIHERNNYNKEKTKNDPVYQKIMTLTAQMVNPDDAPLAYSGEAKIFLLHLLNAGFAIEYNIPYKEAAKELKKEHLEYFEQQLNNSPLKGLIIGNYIAGNFRLTNDQETLDWAVKRFKSYGADNPALVKTLDYLSDIRNKSSLKGLDAYNFNLPDTLDNMVKLSDFKGKVVLLDFMFTGCGGCIAMVPFLKKVEDQFYGRKDLAFISISTDKKNKWRGDNPPSYVHGSHYLYTNNLAFKHEVIKKYNISGMPTLVLIDKTGKIIANPAPDPRYDGGTALKKLIEENLD